MSKYFKLSNIEIFLFFFFNFFFIERRIVCSQNSVCVCVCVCEKGLLIFVVWKLVLWVNIPWVLEREKPKIHGIIRLNVL